MRICLGGEEKETRAVWLQDRAKLIIHMIDQRFLPWKVKIFESRTVDETVYAIKNFVVRGAPTVGATAALGALQAIKEAMPSKNFLNVFHDKMFRIEHSRPTTRNLAQAVKTVSKHVERMYRQGCGLSEILENLIDIVLRYIDMEIERNRMIGVHGKSLIGDNYRILTHCNAGALAAIDIGTATAPIYLAASEGKNITVYVTETRPWLQGARITAWEMKQHGIECYVISDNAAGFLMWRGEIDMVIVGADRIAANGDVANKIGTYKIALAARANNIPFYVAAPTTTIDPSIRTGREIPIEERSEDEIHYVFGESDDGRLLRVRITPHGVKAKNPIFDITPAELITGIITEKGIYRPRDILKALNH